ncbi:MAG: hypothetical protein H5T82_06800, partial [Demequina sp.]|nr:hypothetical protein [Demequina sp.]
MSVQTCPHASGGGCQFDPWQQASGGKVRMIMQVHDELVFEVAEDYVDTARAEIPR